MTFAIHASRNGQSVVTMRISPLAAVDKARLLQNAGWLVHMTDSAGHQISPDDFDRFLLIDRELPKRQSQATLPAAARRSDRVEEVAQAPTGS